MLPTGWVPSALAWASIARAESGGTSRYPNPEQLESVSLDAWADHFALRIVAWDLLPPVHRPSELEVDGGPLAESFDCRAPSMGMWTFWWQVIRRVARFSVEILTPASSSEQ